MASMFDIARALEDPPKGEAILQASLNAEGCLGQDVATRLRQLREAQDLMKKRTVPGVGDNNKPLSELTVDLVDMWCYLQVAHHIKRCKESLDTDGPLVAGFVAPAGGGKSSLVNIIRMLLTDVLAVGTAEEVSIDDFLSARSERPSNGVQTRWDIHSTNEELAEESLQALCNLSAGASYDMPMFSKAQDDRLAKTRRFMGPVDILLFEGWRVGVHHPNFFGMNRFVHTLVYLESDFESILNFKLENIKRDKATDLYDEFGGVDYVFENYYFAVARRYIVPVMHHADVVVSKDMKHHMKKLTWQTSKWRAEKDRQIVEDLDAVVIGGGQAGCCASYFLKKQGLSHVLLESSHELGHTWNAARWDSFKLVTENSLCNLPGFPCTEIGADPKGFMPREVIVKYIQAFAERNSLPVRLNTGAKEVTRAWNGRWIVQLENGSWLRGISVITCVGGFHKPQIPDFGSRLTSKVNQIHSSAYKNPDALSPGAVLVVGSAQSGSQVARELAMKGRQVYLALSKTSGRAPRKVFGRDFTWWLWRTGKYDWRIEDLSESERVRKRFGPNPIQEGGVELRLREISANHGLVVVGRATGVREGGSTMQFDAASVKSQMMNIESNFERLREDVKKFVENNSMDEDLQNLDTLEEEPYFPSAKGEDDPIGELDFETSNISTIIWATGYSLDFTSMIDLPCYDERGYPKVKRGMVPEYPGLFFLGLHWMNKWKSAILMGVAEDAEYVATRVGSRCRSAIMDPMSPPPLFRVASSRAPASPTKSPGLAQSVYRQSPVKEDGSRETGCVGRMEPQLYAAKANSREFQTFLDLLPSESTSIAIRCVDGRKALTYASLVAFARKLDLSRFGIGIRAHSGAASDVDRLCVVIPNGPEAAVCFLSMSVYCSYAPLNPLLTENEIKFEFDDMPAKAAVVMRPSAEAGAKEDILSINARVMAVASELKTPVLELIPDEMEAGLFQLEWSKDSPCQLAPLPERIAGQRQDIALVLHTSGTTKKPKIVPLTHENVAVGSLCIASTVRIQASDINLNVMPLFHIHGLSINILASLLANASVVASPGFRPEYFLDWLALPDSPPTWYSAVPTMHLKVKDRAEEVLKAEGALPAIALQLVRNCSAALPQWVAAKLEEIFDCVVMPTYAMTESMPINSNPRDERRNLRTVGWAAGPDVRVFVFPESSSAVQFTPYPAKQDEEGEVCVRGINVTAGYEFREHMGAGNDPNIEAFYEFEGMRWLRTGDKGFIDSAGMLTLVGRFKEIINKGGEKLSPLEIEEVLQPHPACNRLMCFGMPHESLGEVVGAVVVLNPGADLELHELRQFGLDSGLSLMKLPDVMIFMDAIPVGPTGKPARIRLVGPENCRIKMPPLRDDGSHSKVWEYHGSGDMQPCPIRARKEKVSEDMKTYLQGDTGHTDMSSSAALSNIPLGLSQVRKVVHDYLVHALRNEISDLLNLPPSSVPPTGPLTILGSSSVGITQLKTRIHKKLSCDVASSDLLGRSVTEIADMLAQQMCFGEKVPSIQSDPVSPKAAGPQLIKQPTNLPESDSDESFPMMPLQTAYFVGRNGPNRCGAWIAWETTVKDFDESSFVRAVRWLVERHGMLRAIAYADADTGNCEQRMMKTGIEPFQLEVKRPKPAESFNVWRKTQEEQLRALGYSTEWLDRAYPLFRIDAIQADADNPSCVKVFFLFDLISADATSLNVISRELSLLYLGGRAAKDQLAPVPVDFRQYCLLRQLDCNSHQMEVEREKQWWADMLAKSPEDGGLPPGGPQLPVSNTQSKLQSHNRLRKRLPAATWSNLKRQCELFHVTETSCLLTAYSLALASWSSTRHFLMNVAFFNRREVEVGDNIYSDVSGFVGNSAGIILVPVDLREPRPFKQVVEMVNRNLLSGVDHSRYVSGIQVMQDLNKRDNEPGRAAAPYVFAPALHLSEATDGESKDKNFFNWYGSKSAGGPEYTHLCTPQIHIDQQVFVDLDGALLYNWDYAVGLFPEGLVEDIFYAYTHFLEWLANPENDWDHDLPTLVPRDQLELREEVNKSEIAPTILEAAEAGFLHSPFLEAVNSRPQAPAVMDTASGNALSFEELFKVAQSHASRIAADAGVNPNPVGVLLPKGSLQISAVLGAMLSGRAYTPLNLQWPAPRIERIMEILDAPACLLEKDATAAWSFPQGCQPIEVSLEPCSNEASTFISMKQTCHDTAYVIFTSGSTGDPKGVDIPHVGAANTCLDMNTRFGIGAGDSVLSLAQLSFDLSVYDIFGMLPFGGSSTSPSLIMPDPSKEGDPSHWLDCLETFGVTVWNTAPPVLTMLLEYVMMGDDTQERFQKLPLRLVFLSGDFIPLSLPKLLCRLLPTVKVYSLGGATEVSIWSCWYGPVQGSEIPQNWTSIPYGFPLANQTMHVLSDPRLEPTPEAVIGEICYGGAGLARGYWKDIVKTQAAFKYCAYLGERIYKSGDLGRCLRNNALPAPHSTRGAIEICGRKDFQLKINGYRVEIGEVEAALCKTLGIKEALVLPIGDRGKFMLAGFVEPDVAIKDETEFLANVRESCRAKLPKYMVPAYIHCINPGEWPLSLNGKKDRNALPKLHAARVAKGTSGQDNSRVIVSPSSETETRARRVFAKLVGIEEESVSVLDDMFESGLRSTSAVSLASLLNKEFGLGKDRHRIEPAQLYERRRIADIVGLVEGDHKQEARTSCLRAFNSAGTRVPFFCVAPISGLVLAYAKLCELLGSGHPFYALEHPGIQAGTSPCTSVEAIAKTLLEQVVAEMKKRGCKGLLVLGGWSMGGIIAFEMAKQLGEMQGQDGGGAVPTCIQVVLLDSPAPLGSTEPISRGEMVRTLAYDLTSCRADVQFPCTDAELGSLNSVEQREQLCKVVKSSITDEQLWDGWDDETWDRILSVYMANCSALCSYAPQIAGDSKYRTRLQLVRASRGNEHLKRYGGSSSPDFGWVSLFKLPGSQVIMHMLSGDHYALTDRVSLPTWAGLLRRLLDAADYSQTPPMGMRTHKVETSGFQHLSRRLSFSGGFDDFGTNNRKFRIASGTSSNLDLERAVVEAYSMVLKDLCGPPDVMVVSAGSDCSPETICRMLSQLNRDAYIHAVSTAAGCISERGHFSVGLMGIADPHGRYGVSAVAADSASAQQAGRLATRNALSAAQTLESPALALLSCTAGIEEDVIAGFEQVLGKEVPIIGGTAADASFNNQQWLASCSMGQMQVLRSGVVITLLWPSVRTRLVFSSCYNQTAAEGIATKVEGRIIREIDNKPAAQVYAAWTGSPAIQAALADSERPKSILLNSTLHPIGLRVQPESAEGQPESDAFHNLIHPASILEDDGLSCMAAGMKNGDVLCGMAGSREELVSHIDAVVRAELPHDEKVLGAMTIYCGGCALTIKDSLPQVAASFSNALDRKPLFGFFTFGEQGTDPWGHHRHGNLMMTVVVFMTNK